MSLINQTCWVVGGVGVIGRGITRALLQSGATVIVNSREESRLQRIESDLGNPEKLILVHGSLLPGSAESTVEKVLSNNTPLHHVVAHGAVRYWTSKAQGCDETFSLNNRRLLDMDVEEFASASGQLARLHFNAASALLPRLEGLSEFDGTKTSYTFVTGDGGGHSSGKLSGAGQLNSHHIWGLSSGLRYEMKQSKVAVREVRVGLQVNRSEEERKKSPRERPLSEDIGNLCAGLTCAGDKMDGEMIEVESQQALEENLLEYETTIDESITMPHVWESAGNL
eukprot:CAMPEP_0198262090 /NCGR_PEP_ID=MMETSP1447-20131203/10653_1 /TAXON_ID=420782 /ORGANISM="Chaetoceros dichaeta, Strain CCMP1751" /LENGTH=281 /DNA_ID=CAMNT_0043950205 /DNA_START=26 /DNA_END=871 /DNA_ORIENTATION=-